MQPSRLYVAADGPRPGREDEKTLCSEARRIATKVDWPCKVETLFRETNLGCKNAVSAALSWFFENEEAGIVLEDDCLPNASFFDYCEELLTKYKDVERVLHIGGTNFQDGKRRGDGSYYFSRYSHVWGWASWRRAWAKYDVGMKSFPDFVKAARMKEVFSDRSARAYWLRQLQAVYDNKIDTWDYQWQYAAWESDSLAVVPNRNLVSNIGFGMASTHTSESESRFSNMATYSLGHPIVHPKRQDADRLADHYTFRHAMLAPIWKRVVTKALEISKKRSS